MADDEKDEKAVCDEKDGCAGYVEPKFDFYCGVKFVQVGAKWIAADKLEQSGQNSNEGISKKSEEDST